MKKFSTIFKREFSAYFNAPTAYIYLIVFILMTCGLFMSVFFVSEQASMRSYFSSLPFFLTVFIPAISMRMWAEERKMGTLALLMSFPMPGRVLVLGKFLASMLFYAIGLLGTIFLPIMMTWVGDPDMGAILGGYVGALLLGGFFMAIGIFVSAFFKDQIVALILSIIICFFIYMVGTDFVATFIDGWINGLGSILQHSLGAADHFSVFERGLIDFRSVIYFVSFTVILLILNTYTLESKLKLKPGGRFAVSVLLLLGIGFAVNLVLSETRLARWDLTQGKIYTISDATHRILSRLEAPVEVNYYVSPRDKMPSALKNLQQDVQDKLSDFVQINSNFVYHIYNPLADPNKLKELEEKGVVPFQAQSIEKDSLDIKRVYSAITISYLDRKTEVLSNIVPQRLGQLEYLLMSKIFRMTLKEKPTIAMVAPIELGDPRYRDPRMREFLLKMGRRIPETTDNYSSVMSILRNEGYDVSRIRLNKLESIPEKAGTLLIIDPEELNERQRYEISRFLAGGGNVMICAQNHRFQYRPAPGGGISLLPTKVSTNVNDLVSVYGLSLNSDVLMDSNSQIVNVQVPRKIGGLFQAMVSAPVNFPVQIRIPNENMNQKLPINNRLAALFYIWGGSLNLDKEKIKKLGLKTEVIFSSGPESWLVPFKQEDLAAKDLSKDKNEIKGPLPLAVKITGLFPDPFKGKPIPPWPQSNEKKDTSNPPTQKTSPPYEPQPGSLILIGCADMFTNRALGALNNSLFILNAADSLTLGNDLISIRSKVQTARLIRKLSSGEKIFYRFFTMALAPLVIVVIGTMRLLMRRRRREQYLKMIADGA